MFGSDICTCRPYLIYGIEEAVKEAQKGGSGVVIYFRKEGRALGEVTKVKSPLRGRMGIQPVRYHPTLNSSKTFPHIPHMVFFTPTHFTPHPTHFTSHSPLPHAFLLLSQSLFVLPKMGSNPACSILSTTPGNAEPIVLRNTSSGPRASLA